MSALGALHKQKFRLFRLENIGTKKLELISLCPNFNQNLYNQRYLWFLRFAYVLKSISQRILSSLPVRKKKKRFLLKLLATDFFADSY